MLIPYQIFKTYESWTSLHLTVSDKKNIKTFPVIFSVIVELIIKDKNLYRRKRDLNTPLYSK